MRRLAPILLLSGCLIPMPIEEELQQENYPPFYSPGDVKSDPDRLPDFDPSQAEFLVLSVTGVGDPNLEDLLYYRWFIDYDLSRAKPIHEQGQVVGDAISATFNPCEVVPSDERTKDNLHTADLVIADRPFASNDDPDAEGTRNQMLPPDARYVRIRWYFRINGVCPEPEP